MRYIGVKIVEAVVLTAINARNAGYKVQEDMDPHHQGYEITYPDGYKSWCPEGPFLEANRPCEGMPFGHAIEAAKKGKKIARAGWNGKNMFVVMQPRLELPSYNTQGTNRKVNDRTALFIGKDKPLNCPPYCCLYNAQEEWVCGWVPSQGDLFADDWQIVE